KLIRGLRRKKPKRRQKQKPTRRPRQKRLPKRKPKARSAAPRALSRRPQNQFQLRPSPHLPPPCLPLQSQHDGPRSNLRQSETVAPALLILAGGCEALG